MNMSSFVQGDKMKCASECVKSGWCKSFDLCQKPYSESYCHLKDLDWGDFRKREPSGEKGSSYYGCNHPLNKKVIIYN